jgi:hypothetical protein
VSEAKHYGIVTNVVGNEGESRGDLSVSAILESSPHGLGSWIVVGSTQSSSNLGQFALTADQARKLGALLINAAHEADFANGQAMAKRSTP